MRVNADSLLILAAATSTSGTLNDLTTDLIMANNNNLPLLRVAGEGSDNPIIQSSHARRPFHLASRGTTLSGDIQRSSMLLEVYKCVQLNNWFVICGCVLQRREGDSGFRRLCVVIASLSAFSLLLMPQCAGIHCKTTLWLSISLDSLTPSVYVP